MTYGQNRVIVLHASNAHYLHTYTKGHLTAFQMRVWSSICQQPLTWGLFLVDAA